MSDKVLAFGEKVRSGGFRHGVPHPGWDMETHREAMARYSAAEANLLKSFSEEALRALGLSDHPKAAKLFAMAWEDGHPHGFEAVWHHMQRLSELLK